MDIDPHPGITLTCRPNREGHRLVFEYALRNPGERPVYVLDAMPAVDRSSRAARANQQAVSIVHGASGDAVVGKFVPPMPSSPRPAMQVTPLAHLLGRGETMQRRLEVAEPLAETSPYLPDLLLRQYEVVDIPAVVFTVGYWVAGQGGFGVTPAPYESALWKVMLGAGPVGGMLVSQRFATRGLQIFRRTDDFPRTLAA